MMSKKIFLPCSALLFTACPLVSDADHAARIDLDGDDLVAIEYPGGVDCDDRDASVGEGRMWFLDEDADGYGVGEGVQSCTPIAGRASRAGDCDDGASTIHPTAIESCNGLDDDCDGERDDGFSVFPAFRDSDRDGVGSDLDAIAVCAVPEGYSEVGGDCDDTDALITPGRSELCNGLDDNCNGERDEGLSTQPFYADADGDGYGDSSRVERLCVAADGFVADATDCDDAHGTVFPGATELCNGLDDDCDSVPDDGLSPLRPFYPDEDGDGFGDDTRALDLCAAPDGWVDTPGDCNDAAVAISPAAAEDCAVDGDEDCNPRTSCGPRGNMMALGTSWFAPESADWETGSAIAVVRDGDLTRIAVGARNYDMDTSAANGGDGAVYIVIAPRNPIRTELEDGVFVESGRQSFGHAITDVADMDGDGVRDFLVGAPETLSYTGRAYVISSASVDSVVPEIDAPLLGIIPSGDWYTIGYALDAGGDLTGDGVEDLVVGSPFSGSGGNAARGYVAVMSTSLRGTVNVASAPTYIEGDGGDEMGTSVAVLPDFNGDGFSDLAVGAPRDDASGMDSGAVGIFLGPLPEGRLRWRDADAFYLGISAGDLAGTSVADAGDVNGDGLSDLIVGAPGRSQSGVTSRGGVYIIEGRVNPTSYTLASADGILLGQSSLFYMGDVVAGAGDVDGNGLDDVLMGHPRSIENRGRGILQMAPFTPTVRVVPDGFVASTHPAHQVGYSMAAAGDVNDDGYDDILFGVLGANPLYDADGSVILVYGQP